MKRAMRLAVFAAQTGGAPRRIPALYPWRLHRYFDQEERGLSLAWGMARQWLYAAREQRNSILDGFAQARGGKCVT